ncbi:MAG TPA: hypothetical protein VF610_13115 [Segetibacter sp.]|jgi:hypothetical protein
MLSAKDAAIVFETLLTSPGMNDTIKVSLQLSRKNVLLLVKLIELAMTVKEEEQGSLIHILNGSGADGISQINTQLLQKAGLTDMYERLNKLETK